MRNPVKPLIIKPGSTLIKPKPALIFGVDKEKPIGRVTGWSMRETIGVGIINPMIHDLGMTSAASYKLSFPLGESGWVLKVIVRSGGASLQLMISELASSDFQLFYIGNINGSCVVRSTIDLQRGETGGLVISSVCGRTGEWLWHMVDEAVRVAIDPEIGSLLPSERSKIKQIPDSSWPSWAGISKEIEDLILLESVMSS